MAQNQKFQNNDNRPPKTREEIALEREQRRQRKLEVAGQPGSHVFQAPAGPEMESWLQLSRTLNDLYPRFKLHTGAFGSVGQAKGERITTSMIKLCLETAYLCEQISKNLPEKHLPFRVPRAMQKAYEQYRKQRQAEENPQQDQVKVKAVKTAALPVGKKAEVKPEKEANTLTTQAAPSSGKLAVMPSEVDAGPVIESTIATA